MDENHTIAASAPGNLMLLGEHAVLHGKKALVCAINRRIDVRLFPLAEQVVKIVSELGCYQSPLEDLEDHPALRFALQAIRQHRGKFPSGFELKIDSEFSSEIGFGSSAAVTVATHAALMKWIQGRNPLLGDLFSQSLTTVRAVQGRGSGADVAASVHGGIVAYSTDPWIDPVAVSLPLTAVFCGYKTPTPEVIRRVEALRAADTGKYERIYDAIDRSVPEAVACLRRRDLPGFGKILNQNHQLMDEMGVNTPELAEIVAALQAAPDVFGAKISGSGLGDCAVGIGYAGLETLAYPVHHLEITPAGCEWH